MSSLQSKPTRAGLQRRPTCYCHHVSIAPPSSHNQGCYTSKDSFIPHYSSTRGSLPECRPSRMYTAPYTLIPSHSWFFHQTYQNAVEKQSDDRIVLVDFYAE